MKKRSHIFTFSIVLSLLFGFAFPLFAQEVTGKPSNKAVNQKIGKLQIPFISNEGKMDEKVKFYANTFGGTVFVTNEGEIVYSLPKGSEAENADCRGEWHLPDVIPDAGCEKHDNLDSCIKPCRLGEACPEPVEWAERTQQNGSLQGIALKETLIGAKVKGINGENKSVTKVNYFKGNDQKKWKSNISTYDVVDLGEVYKGIELKLKAYGNNVEKLFYVKPGADPDKIKISLSGIQRSVSPSISSIRETGVYPPLAGIGGGLRASGLWANEQGQLVAETELGPVTFTKPVAYQEIDGKRVNVEVEYNIQNRKEPAISPLKRGVRGVLNSKTHNTKRINHEFPTPDSQCLVYGFKVASYDKTKELIIDPLLASTFLGGSGSEVAYTIAIDASGNVYVTGYTSSTDFPATVGVYNTSDNGSSDVFVSKLDGGLTSLLASTYLGGSDYEYGYSLAFDTGGNVYVTGSTKSSDFPTTSGAYDTSGDTSSDNYDVFVSKLSSDLSNLIASTFLGGSDSELAYSTSLDTDGNIYVTGATKSSDFPTTAGAYDVTGETSSDNYDVFVSKLNSDLSNLIASTFLGGSGNECAYSMALDAGNNIYLAGETESSGFPVTSGAYDTTYNGIYGYYGSAGYYDYYSGRGGDTFVTKLDSNLDNLLASTFLGGSSDDRARSLAIDTGGNIYVTGFTSSSDFPTTSEAYDTTGHANASDPYYNDVFITKLGSDLSSLIASTFLGGDVTGRDKDSGQDYAWSIATDPNGDVYVTGYTDSSSFPTTSGVYDAVGPDENTTHAEDDAFVSKLDSNLGSLIASTFLGGYGNDDTMTLWGEYGNDEARSLAIDSNGNVYVAGHTNSPNFPTTSGAYDTNFRSFIPVPTACATPCTIYYVEGYDVFISKFDGDLSADTTSPSPTPTVTTTATPTPTDEACKAETITTDPEKKLVIKRNQSDTVTVSVLGTDGCPVEGTVVKARLNSRSKKKISVTSGATTDADGKAAFTVTAYNKKGTAEIVFSQKGLKKKAKLKVKVK